MSCLYQKENISDLLNFSETRPYLIALWTWEAVKHLSNQANKKYKRQQLPLSF